MIMRRATLHELSSAVQLVPSACLVVERLLHARSLRWIYRDQKAGAVITSPPVSRSCDPAIAQRAYRGEFVLTTGRIEAGVVSPFELKNIPSPVLRELSSFSWLRHFTATESEIARAHARRLISVWIDTAQENAADAWHPPVVARRIVSWLEASPFFLKNASGVFHNSLKHSLNAQIRFLSLTARWTTDDYERLSALIGLSIAALCVEGHEPILAKALPRMARELDRQILPDGGHINRSPWTVLYLLQDLDTLKAILQTRNQAAPKSVVSAVDRMVPMLRFFQLGDRGLCFFNGSNLLHKEAATRILKAHPQSGQPLAHARQSKFQRMEADQTTLIVDVDANAPADEIKSSHVGGLAFEMSDGPHRVIVNCGSVDDLSSPWHSAARSTAAHSTLVLEEENQQSLTPGSLWRRWFSAKQIPGKSSSIRRAKNGEHLVQAENDGYLARFGLRHRRRIYLSRDGGDIRGEDILRYVNSGLFSAGPDEKNFAIRFHIHPDVKITRAQNPHSILLLLPNRNGWTFSTAGVRLELEESVYLVGRHAPRRSQQIVLHGTVKKQAQIKWALKRLDRSPKNTERATGDTLELPLEG